MGSERQTITDESIEAELLSEDSSRASVDARPSALAHRRFAEFRHMFAGLDVAERFARIHGLNLWGAKTSVSGLGSEAAATATLEGELGLVLSSLEVRSLLDAPCGDANWISRVDLKGMFYVGIDIVPELVSALQARQQPPGFYLRSNLITDYLPRMDAVLCRDCLVHLNFEHALQAAANLRSTAKQWLIVTTFTELAENVDCEDGDWRPLNMTKPPFEWPEPDFILNENCEEDGGGWRDKSLGFWRIERLR